MLKSNEAAILKRLKPNSKVLDIGGWGGPFNRANYIVDVLPYETRNMGGEKTKEKEYFSKKTWIIHDLNCRKPLPFKDKEFDFVVCSHTLEDIRDPISLCAEINRVGKAGYLEVPSRTIESIKGSGGGNFVGAYHHRWLVEFDKNAMIFRFKTHLIHGSWRYHLPKSYLKKLTEEQKVSYLFWKGSFDYYEAIQISNVLTRKELERFVRSKHAYPELRYRLSDIKEKVVPFIARRPRLRDAIAKVTGRRIAPPEGQQMEMWRTLKEIKSR